MNFDLKAVTEHFGISSVGEPYGRGHIHDTYRMDSSRYILQRINTHVFQDVDGLMENIALVTSFLKKRIAEEGGDPDRDTMTLIKTLDGKSYYRQDAENVFRLYRFIAGTVTLEARRTYQDLYEEGRGWGHFQRLLRDFPTKQLKETIPDFHHTPKRVEALALAVKGDAADRAARVEQEIRFALKRAGDCDRVVRGMAWSQIPLRVTHNDTKLNNILFDEQSGKAVCVIDLDTVMPGSLLYDYGDALRTCGAVAAEDETDLEKVSFDLEAFRYFSRGYLEEMGEALTEAERELLPFSVKLMTYECGVRFLTDYLNGDTYFKTNREDHNLDRARNQFRLVEDLEQKETEMREILGAAL